MSARAKSVYFQLLSLLLVVLLSGCVWVQKESGGAQGSARVGDGAISEQLLSEVVSLELVMPYSELPLGTEQSLQLLALTGSGVSLLIDHEIPGLSWEISDTAVLELQQSPKLALRGLLPAENISITATLNRGGQPIRATQQLSITDAVLESITLQGESIQNGVLRLPLGTSLAVNAIGQYSDGSSLDITSQVAWQVTDPAPLDIDSKQTLAEGTLDLWATREGVDSAALSVEVIPPVPVSLTITPSQLSLPPGASTTVRLEGEFTDGVSRLLNADSINESQPDNPLQVTSLGEAGLYRIDVVTEELKLVTLEFNVGGVIATLDATIEQLQVKRIELGSALGTQPTLATGESLALTSTAFFNDGTSLDVSAQTSWQSAAPAVASLSASNGQLLQAGSSPAEQPVELTATYTDSRGTQWQEVLNVTVANPVTAVCGLYTGSVQTWLLMQLSNHSQSRDFTLQTVTAFIESLSPLVFTEQALAGNQALPAQTNLLLTLDLPVSGTLTGCDSQIAGLGTINATLATSTQSP